MYRCGLDGDVGIVKYRGSLPSRAVLTTWCCVCVPWLGYPQQRDCSHIACAGDFGSWEAVPATEIPVLLARRLWFTETGTFDEEEEVRGVDDICEPIRF
jgi:hypothetical protein